MTKQFRILVMQIFTFLIEAFTGGKLNSWNDHIYINSHKEKY